MATVKMMRYVGIPQVINKTPSTIRTLNGTFRQPLDLMNPVIEISGSRAQDDLINNNVNYFEVEGKYYYLMNWKLTHNNMVEVNLHLDVLMTYRNEIDNLHVMLERSSTADNFDVPDSMLPISSNRVVEQMEFPNGWEDDEESGTYIMVTNQTGYAVSTSGGD